MSNIRKILHSTCRTYVKYMIHKNEQNPFIGLWLIMFVVAIPAFIIYAGGLLYTKGASIHYWFGITLVFIFTSGFLIIFNAYFVKWYHAKYIQKTSCNIGKILSPKRKLPYRNHLIGNKGYNHE